LISWNLCRYLFLPSICSCFLWGTLFYSWFQWKNALSNFHRLYVPRIRNIYCRRLVGNSLLHFYCCSN